MRNLWIIYIMVSAADLFLSVTYLTPAMEANPMAAWTWTAFGYVGLILYKISAISIIYAICKEISKRNIFLTKSVLSFGIVSTSAVCLLFGAFYI